ncbi:hypothetical protein [Mesorhizobium sp. M0217]|uniref:hypothetical protein n=1 Tax=unclassified Mesorhizobium TaxID=325217 RepID=UPI0033397426
MIFIPLPFVVALLLVILLAQMIRRNEADLRENMFFMLLMAAYALESVLIGIRWGYDVRAIMPFQAVLATLIAPLAWIAFSGLARDARGIAWLRCGRICCRPVLWPCC